jgi:hypothetical protein
MSSLGYTRRANRELYFANYTVGGVYDETKGYAESANIIGPLIQYLGKEYPL